jgi:hypothetical protein
MKKAAALGYRPIELVPAGWAPRPARRAWSVASIATTIERCGTPFEPPCALFTSGELLVTVGQEKGIGGRNQEYAMAAALRIAGSPNVSSSAPWTPTAPTAPAPSSPRGAALGTTRGSPPWPAPSSTAPPIQRACELGIDLRDELRHHNTTPALCRLDSGVVATHNISLNDLCVTLIMDRTVDVNHSRLVHRFRADKALVSAGSDSPCAGQASLATLSDESAVALFQRNTTQYRFDHRHPYHPLYRERNEHHASR